MRVIDRILACIAPSVVVCAVVACAVVACAVVACGGATPSPGTTLTAKPLPDANAALPVAEMQYVIDDEGKTLVTLTVHADGSIESHGRTTAHIVERRVVCVDGSELLHLDAEDGVVVEGKVVAHLLADGTFAMDEHWGTWRVTVRDDGDVALTTKSEGTATSHALRWEPFHVEARRTASLLTGLLTPTFAGLWCGERRPTNPQ